MRLALGLLFLALTCPPALAGEVKFSVHQWSTQDGLPQNTIKDLAQTPDGALWMATVGGLVRFDGQEFETFDLAGFPEIGNSRLTQVEVDGAGELLVGTAAGKVLRRTFGGWYELRLPPAPEASVTDILADETGATWITTTSGLYRSESGSGPAELVQEGHFLRLAGGAGGVVLAGGAWGIWSWDAGQLKRIADFAPVALAASEEGGIFASDGLQVLQRIGEAWTPLAIPSGHTRAMRLDREGRLWVGGNGRFGHWHVAEQLWEPSDEAIGMTPTRKVLSILVDREGNLWLGTGSRGILELSRTPLDAVLPHAQWDQATTSVVRDAEGNVFAIGESLWKVDGDQLVGLPGPPPLVFAPAREGGLWLFTERGLERLRGEARELQLSRTEIPIPLRVLLESEEGLLWMAGPSKVLSWDGQLLEELPLSKEAIGTNPTALFEDSRGRLWIGSRTGICVWDGTSTRVLQGGKELPVGTVRGFYEAEDGRIWVGSYGGGVYRIDDLGVSVVDENQGLFENIASALVPYGEGRLLIMGNRAIVGYSLSDLQAVADGAAGHLHGRIFDCGPGIEIFEGNAAAQPRAATDAAGTIWFPTLEGLARFEPEGAPAPTIPPIVTAEIRVHDPTHVEFGPDRVMTYSLSSGTREAQLRFSAPSFVRPRQVHYRYRLAGLDTEWITAADESTISYSQLPPGDYTFEIEAAVADGLYGPRNSRIRLHVPPTLLERPIFQFALILAALLAVAGLGFLGLRIAKGQSAILEVKVRTRTRDLEREILQRTRVEERLRLASEGLEQKVERRTEQLARALADLERDLLQRENLETRLRESEKLEAIGRLAGGLAHDFNNILTAVLGETDLAQADLEGEGDVEVLRRQTAQHLDNVRDAGLRAARLTRQLLAYSRQQVMQREVIDPLATLTELHSMLLRLVPDDVEITLAPGSVSSPILIDPGQLEQVVVNLVVNAAEAMPEGGRIELGCQVLKPKSDSATLEIRVSDTGIGLSDKERQRIFEPFYSTKGQARGLGLASVHGIVLQSGGAIHVESQVGHGTTFRVTLPITDRQPVVASVREQSVGIAGITALLVDDEADVRRIARSMLEHSGVHVIDSGDPLQALELAKRHAESIDVLITDVVMPSLNGKQLSEAVCALSPHIKVLFISGYSAEVLSDRDLLGSGANILTKPFDARTLVARVAELFRAERSA